MKEIPVAELQEKLIDNMRENADLRAELANWKEDHRRVMSEECAPDEKHCTCVPALRKRIFELEADRDDTFSRLVHSERTRVENESRIETLENKIIRLEGRVKDEYARRAYLEAALKIDDWDGDA
jgi:hypothetical protein